MDETTGLVNAAPFVGLISQIVMWIGLLAALAMLKNFISHGISLAFAEFLLKVTDTEQQEKIARWFGNGSVVLAKLYEINERLKNEE